MEGMELIKAESRGRADHGWLKTNFSFSFAEYRDEKRIHFGALRVMNDDFVAAGMGFGMHPHDNMEIISIILEGSLEHKDSMGNGEVVAEGEVQVMSAGTGVRHSEFNPSETVPVKLFQIWIFPEERGLTPRYDQRWFDATERKNNWQILVNPINSGDGGLGIHQQAWISRASLDAGQELIYKPFSKDSGLYIMNISGSTKLKGALLGHRDAMSLAPAQDLIFASEQNSDILVIEVPMKF